MSMNQIYPDVSQSVGFQEEVMSLNVGMDALTCSNDLSLRVLSDCVFVKKHVNTKRNLSLLLDRICRAFK